MFEMLSEALFQLPLQGDMLAARSGWCTLALLRMDEACQEMPLTSSCLGHERTSQVMGHPEGRCVRACMCVCMSVCDIYVSVCVVCVYECGVCVCVNVWVQTHPGMKPLPPAVPCLGLRAGLSSVSSPPHPFPSLLERVDSPLLFPVPENRTVAPTSLTFTPPPGLGLSDRQYPWTGRSKQTLEERGHPLP